MDYRFYHFRDWVEWRTGSPNCWYGWRWLVDQSNDEIRRIATGTTADTDLTFEEMKANAVAYIHRNVPNPHTNRPATGVKVRKLTTREYRAMCRDLDGVAPGPTGRLKCWEAALDAFGVTKRTGKGEYSYKYRGYLEDEGWEVTKVESLAPEGVTPTLAVFLADHLTGDYLVEMATHVIAARDGVITDTQHRTATVARRVTGAYQLRKKPVPRPVGKIQYPHPECDCPDPIVWGHVNPSCPTGLGKWRART